MRAPSSLKKEFLKKWMSGLQECSSGNYHMSILERKKAIKLSADIAIASTRNGSTCWRRALIANASKDGDNETLVKHILANEFEKHKIQSNSKSLRCKKILKKSRCIHRARKNLPQMVRAKAVARSMIKKRTQVLKSLVPGGEFMDDVSLIEETLDYIVSLRAQVDVMRTLTKATELLNGKTAIWKCV